MDDQALTEASVGNRKCAICSESVPEDELRAHYIKTHNLRDNKNSNPKEYCASHQKWFTHSQRGRHYKDHHANGDPPPSNTVVVINPKTGEVVERKRIIGSKSKLYSPATQATSGLPQPLQILSLAQKQTARSKHAENQVSRQLEVIEKEIEDTPTLVDSTDKNGRSRKRRNISMWTEEFSAYKEVWDRRLDGEALSYAGYMAHYQAQTLDEQLYAYIVCTPEEARSILNDHLPRRSIVVPQSARSSLSISTFLDELATKDVVDVQDMQALISHSGRNPTAVPAKEAVSWFVQSPPRRINLLNLANTIDNPVPACIAGLNEYDILSKLNDTSTAGKKVFTKLTDLSNCATFLVCSKEGVWSGAHQDHYGLLTTVFIEEGLKVWLTWPELNREQRLAWAKKGVAEYPDQDPFPIYLQTGDLLVQPPQTVHAPFTHRDCLMSGTQHFHTPSMHMHLDAANFERTHSQVTNETEAHEAAQKFTQIGTLMENNSPRWRWPGAEDQARCLEAISHYCDDHRTNRSCWCTGQCADNPLCECFANEYECNSECHGGTKCNSLNPSS